MNPVSIIKKAIDAKLTNVDGEPYEIELSGPISDRELALLTTKVPCPIPEEIRELLAYCKGFTGGPANVVDFTGESLIFGHDNVFPFGHAIADDGAGNCWVVDIRPPSTAWGPIYFVCHDPPAFVYQAADMEEFLVELLMKSGTPPFSRVASADDVFDVWRFPPQGIPLKTALQSSDALIREFATQLDSSFEIVDLRDESYGTGLPWGRYAEIRRYKTEFVFAVRAPFVSRWLSKIFGGL